jgi:hypothetical protein
MSATADRPPVIDPRHLALAEIAGLVMAPGLVTITDMIDRLMAIHTMATTALEEAQQ